MNAANLVSFVLLLGVIVLLVVNYKAVIGGVASVFNGDGKLNLVDKALIKGASMGDSMTERALSDLESYRKSQKAMGHNPSPAEEENFLRSKGYPE